MPQFAEYGPFSQFRFRFERRRKLPPKLTYTDSGVSASLVVLRLFLET